MTEAPTEAVVEAVACTGAAGVGGAGGVGAEDGAGAGVGMGGAFDASWLAVSVPPDVTAECSGGCVARNLIATATRIITTNPIAKRFFMPFSAFQYPVSFINSG